VSTIFVWEWEQNMFKKFETSCAPLPLVGVESTVQNSSSGHDSYVIKSSFQNLVALATLAGA